MAGKPRVHEIATELGVNSKLVLQILKNMGEYAMGSSSSIEPPVARRLRAAVISGGYALPVFPALEGEAGRLAGILAEGLPRTLPELIDLLVSDYVPGTEVADIFAQASQDRWFFFVPERANETLLVAAVAPILKETELPSPRGILVAMRPTGLKARPQLIAWALEHDSLRVATTTLRSNTNELLSATGTRHWTLAREDSGYPNNKVASLQLLSKALSLIPERLPTYAPAEDPPPQTGRQRPEPASSEETRVIYATRSVLGLGSSGAGNSSARSGQWNVRGHWRNQWHPSTEDHQRIWIEDHTSGNFEGEVQSRDRVYMIAPRSGMHS